MTSQPKTEASNELVLALSVKDSRKALGGIGNTLFYELLKQKKIKSFTIAGRRLVLRSELEAFVAREAANAV